MAWLKRKIQRNSNLETSELLPMTFHLELSDETLFWLPLSLTLTSSEKRVVQSMNKKTGMWCIFPWIQECFLLSLYLCPWMSSLSPPSPYPLHLSPVQCNSKAQPDSIRTGSFSSHPQELLFLLKASHLPPQWWTKTPWNRKVIWLWTKVVISHSRISRNQKKQEKFRDNVQEGMIERNREASPKKILLKNMPRTLTS